MENYAEISVDYNSKGLVCKTGSDLNRRNLLKLFRRVCPHVQWAHHAGTITLDIKSGLSLRSCKERLPLEWTDEALAFIDNFAAAYAERNSARHRLLKLQNQEVSTEVLADYPLLKNLDDHQQIAVAAMTDPLISGLCLFDEQGVGKTVMTIHAFDRLVQLGKSDALLIFAPKNMLLPWKQDFERFFGDKYRIEIVAGQRRDKYEKLLASAQVYVTNYETAHLMEGSIRSLLTRNRGRIVMAVDESFFVKNSDTERSGAVRRLRNYVNRCWVLCGTPAPNHATDVIHQFEVADCGVTFASVSLPKEPEELRDTIKNVVEKRGLYLRRLKGQVFPDLPKKNFENVSVPMEPQQLNLYSRALSGLLAEVEASNETSFRKSMPSFLAQRMALFQICSHPRQLFPAYEAVPGKHLALDRLLDELIRVRNEKVVVWSFFRYSLNELQSRYHEYRPVRVDGSVSSAEARGEAVARFQTDPETMLFLGNPAAAGAGITLTASRIAIYESFPVQTAHYLQSVDRIHRRGQTRDAHYYFLLGENSIEEGEYLRLLDKESKAMDLFGDPDPGVLTREVFLDELMRSLRRFRTLSPTTDSAIR